MQRICYAVDRGFEHGSVQRAGTVSDRVKTKADPLGLDLDNYVVYSTVAGGRKSNTPLLSLVIDRHQVTPHMARTEAWSYDRLRT